MQNLLEKSLWNRHELLVESKCWRKNCSGWGLSTGNIHNHKVIVSNIWLSPLEIHLREKKTKTTCLKVLTSFSWGNTFLGFLLHVKQSYHYWRHSFKKPELYLFYGGNSSPKTFSRAGLNAKQPVDLLDFWSFWFTDTLYHYSKLISKIILLPGIN